jgi:hypothetical protein
MQHDVGYDLVEGLAVYLEAGSPEVGKALMAVVESPAGQALLS